MVICGTTLSNPSLIAFFVSRGAQGSIRTCKDLHRVRAVNLPERDPYYSESLSTTTYNISYNFVILLRIVDVIYPNFISLLWGPIGCSAYGRVIAPDVDAYETKLSEYGVRDR